MAEDKAVCNTPAAGEEEEEELVDPQEKMREKCRETSECAKLIEKLQTCNDRVNSRTKTAETCMEEIIDVMHCVDHCASKKLFNFLK